MQSASGIAPLVSVRTITYNHAPYIRQCIEGVLAQQTVFPFEYIIGEDCSTDGTREIVLEYGRRHPDRIRVITSEQNVGMRANGQRTRDACRGRYVAICEGDDCWHDPNKLQRQVDFLIRHPECGVVHTEADSENVRTGKRVRNMHRVLGDLQTEGGLFCNLLATSYRVITCTACVRADMIEQALRSPARSGAQVAFPMGDTPLWLDLSRLTQFGYLDLPTATYRILPESASRSLDLHRHLQFQMDMLRMRVHYMDAYGVTAAFRRDLVERWGRSRLELAARLGSTEVVEELWHLMVAARARLGRGDRLHRRCAYSGPGRVFLHSLHLAKWLLGRLRRAAADRRSVPVGAT